MVSIITHRHQWKFVNTRVCKVAFKHLPLPLRSHTQSFGTVGQHLKRDRGETMLLIVNTTFCLHIYFARTNMMLDTTLDMAKNFDALKLVIEDKGDLYNPTHGQH